MTTDDRLIAGRYRLGEKIGSGAMGVVWQAHDERLHRTVAVKQLLLQPGLSEASADEARRRCMREGRIAARLQHPNAITVYDVAEHAGEPWLVMEYLPSKSLATVLAEQDTLSPQETARIGAQVASALTAAHNAGIVHRDIKPANVLLGDDGVVKITDFGISRATGDVTVTATGMLAGTPAYLAPEVAKGEEPTPAADVFSLGSTLYTMIEGHSPFGLSENTLALLYAVAAGRISPPRQAGPLTALLMRLLRVDPGERPTMASLKDTLAEIAVGRTAALPPIDQTVDFDQTVRHQNPYQQSGPPTPPRAHPATRVAPNPMMGTPPGGQRLATPPAGQRMITPPGGHPVAAPPAQRSSTKAIVLTVLAILAAAAVGILVASLLAGGGDNQTQQPPTSTNAVVQPTTTQKTTAPTTTTSASTTTTSAQTVAAPTPAELENAVRAYYALIPAQPDAAWATLTPNAQAKSRGREVYDKFLASLASVEVLKTQAQGNQVVAFLKFVRKNGKPSVEVYRYVLAQDATGKLLINDFARVNGR